MIVVKRLRVEIRVGVPWRELSTVLVILPDLGRVVYVHEHLPRNRPDLLSETRRLFSDILCPGIWQH